MDNTWRRTQFCNVRVWWAVKHRAHDDSCGLSSTQVSTGTVAAWRVTLFPSRRDARARLADYRKYNIPACVVRVRETIAELRTDQEKQ